MRSEQIWQYLLDLPNVSISKVTSLLPEHLMHLDAFYLPASVQSSGAPEFW